ncbi:interleukin-36 receptor antagonist protein-like [Sceloporus undulatus]|uniref:interleukin-36 receptor antagonist protein-like n=1 Tax=Sceloporus undulatus TaxID=8520 RepID=UPI001C4D9A49|nr:interleukin-36 receptor antagonist protein-like [Sceloporus undulatus]
MDSHKNKHLKLKTERCKLKQQKLEKDNKLHKRTWNEEMADLFIAEMPKPVPNSEKTIYRPLREKEPRLYRIWDVSQKFLFLVNNIIVANAGNSNAPEVFMEVFPNTALDPKMQPIFMGPNGRKYSLSCVKDDGDEPQLQLKEIDIKKLYNQNQDSLNFTFYSKTDGSPETCSFESAEFPGWFMSTSPEPNKPVGLSRQGGAENTLFYFQRHSNTMMLQ